MAEKLAESVKAAKDKAKQERDEKIASLEQTHREQTTRLMQTAEKLAADKMVLGACRTERLALDRHIIQNIGNESDEEALKKVHTDLGSIQERANVESLRP